MNLQSNPLAQRTCEIFEAAQTRFLDSLSPSDRQQCFACSSAADFSDSVKKLETLATHAGRRNKSLRCVYSLARSFECFFEVVSIFVSSNPQILALFWGAFRLVLQLSSNFATFFDKLLELLDQLLVVFPRYEDIAKLCTDENSDRIRKNIEEVYVDIFGIFQIATRVFIRPSGKRKRTPVVLGGLLWQPFNLMFKELLDKMAVHNHNLSEEVKVWKLKRDDKQSIATAKWRVYVQNEHQSTEKERTLALEERRLMAEERKLAEAERKQDAESRANISTLLSEIQDAKSNVEQQRLEATVARVQEWLQPSNHLDTREMNSKMRDNSTALWIFDHPKYRFWIDTEPRTYVESNKRKFGSNMLWIHGHPGSGKTILATSILDELDEDEDQSDKESHIILYHFFRFNLETSRSPAAAFRSLLSQILWNCRYDENTVDKFVFMMTSKSQGQLNASEGTLADLLHICLDHKAIIVVDGVDECNKSDSFVSSLFRLSHTCKPRILFLSRINVPRLQRLVRIESQLSIPKQELSRDIRRFCERELQELIEEEILPELAQNDQERLTEHLVKGADGMFLWARLMMEFLRSPSLSQQRRMKIIVEIKFPEGLEKMYSRIFLLIIESGQSTRNLATQIFTWLVHCAAPITTSQIRQALIIEDLWTAEDQSEDINEFQNAAIMACKGLVELVPTSNTSSSTQGLQLIHLTAKEVLTRPNTISIPEAISSGQDEFTLPVPEIANLQIARCCLRQLLYHTPAQPLSGQFHQSISRLALAKAFPFTDYAALYWMNHVSATVIKSPEITTQVNKIFESAFNDFAEVLRGFLSAPKCVTTWLEAYYTSPYTASPSGSGIRKWASWLSNLTQETNLRVDGALFGLIFEFRNDLDRIVKIWDSKLRLTPHILWDEATASGLAPSQLFFSSGSTRVKSRAPEKPDILGIINRAYASISAVSADGSLLGVLSLWSNKIYPIRYGTEADINSKIWVASYELWPLDLDRSRVAKLVVHLDIQDLESCIISDREPMSISCDGLSFSVLNKIWRMYPQPTSITKGLAREPWPDPINFKAITLTIHNTPFDRKQWSLYSSRIAFSPDGRYVISVVRYLGHGQNQHEGKMISAFELTPKFKVKPLLILTFKDDDIARNDSQILFHPHLPLCLHWIKVMRAPFHFWDFQNGPNTLRSVKVEYQYINAIHFSECGSFIVCERKYNNSVTVLQIPPDLLFSRKKHWWRRKRLESPGEVDSNSLLLAKPDLSIAVQEHRPQIHGLGGGRMVKGFSATLGSDNAVALSSSMLGGEIQLKISKMDGSATDVLQLATIPEWQGSSNSRAEVKLPQLAGDAATIVIHRDYATDLQGTQLPLVIERDPIFITQQQGFLEHANMQVSDSDHSDEGDESDEDDQIYKSNESDEDDEGNEGDDSQIEAFGNFP